VWAERTFGQADLGDKRRTRRLVDVAAALAGRPLSSFCATFEQWSNTKGAYRLIENEKVTVQALRAPITRAAVEACRNQSLVLAVSDTTALNFTNHRATLGLGHIGEAQVQGLWFHSTILLRPDGCPLGLLRQQSWARDPEGYGQHRSRQYWEIEKKESYRWVQTVTEASQALAFLPDQECPRLIHLFDREGDIHEVFEAVVECGEGCVIRSARNRKTKNPSDYLQDSVLSGPALGRRTIQVPRKQGERKRTANVEYRACALTLNPPGAGHPKRMPVEVNVVAVTEPRPPEGVEPLQWILVTTEPIDTLEDVIEIVRLYTLRWRIEEYHLILKSGCRIEKVQFETAERITKVLSLLAAALRLLQLTYRARVEPDLPCTEVLIKDEWRALVTRIEGRPPSKRARPPTLKQAVLWIGRLGGHLGRKSDGMPGVRTMWQGWRDLQILVVMYRACTQGPDPIH
jgi:hypothetical protein